MANKDRRLTLRSDKVAFAQIPGTEEYIRMEGFTSLATSKNPIEYTRHYVDQRFETTDTTGMTSEIGFEMDEYENDPVCEYIVKIFDNELVGDEANIRIAVIDLLNDIAADGSEGREGKKVLSDRVYAVVPDTQGDGVEAMKYTGTFKPKTEIEKGIATTTDEWMTATVKELTPDVADDPIDDTGEEGADDGEEETA